MEQVRWLKHTITLQVPPGLREKLEADNDMPEKLRAAEKVDITLTAKLTLDGISVLESNERLLYAYLPTEENAYNIPVLVNGAFYTVANRETLHKESLWNEWLFSCIPIELLKWIAVLVSAARHDAYNLLPAKLHQTDLLANAYNEQQQYGIQAIPLVLNNNSGLLRVPEALIDFTFLSEKGFVGAAAIRNWSQVPSLLETVQFAEAHNAADNIALLGYLKAISQNDKITEVTDEILKNWPFILDHKNELKSPKEVFFPAADDVAEASSALSFIHGDLQQWLDSNKETKAWLEDLGVVEKTDVSFLEKTILPNAANYITLSETSVIFIRKSPLVNRAVAGILFSNSSDSVSWINEIFRRPSTIPETLLNLVTLIHPGFNPE